MVMIVFAIVFMNYFFFLTVCLGGISYTGARSATLA